MCLSVFVRVRRRALAGGATRALPGTYLREGETPAAGARRVLRGATLRARLPTSWEASNGARIAALMHAPGVLWRMGADGAGGGAVYGLGFLGAAIYYIQAADGFWIGVLGVLKAIVWPAFLVYELLGLVHG